jgi:hypothetical protein
VGEILVANSLKISNC